MKTRTLPALLLALFLTLSSCVKDTVDVRYMTYTDQEYQAISAVLGLPNDRVDYDVELPRHMLDLGMVPPKINNAFSEGFDGQLTLRNSLALVSVANFKSSYEGGGGGSLAPPSQRQFSSGTNAPTPLPNRAA